MGDAGGKSLFRVEGTIVIRLPIDYSSILAYVWGLIGGKSLFVDTSRRSFYADRVWRWETIFLLPGSRARNDEAAFDGWIMEGLHRRGFTRGWNGSTLEGVLAWQNWTGEGRRYPRINFAAECPQLFGGEQVVREESAPETVARVESNQPQRSRASSRTLVNPSSRQEPLRPNNTITIIPMKPLSLSLSLTHKLHASQLLCRLRGSRLPEAMF